MNSLATLFTSRKTQRVILGITIQLVTLYFTLPTLTTPEAKMGAIIAAITGIGLLLGIDIHGIAKEDAAKSLAGQEPSGDPPTVVAPAAPSAPVPQPQPVSPAAPAQPPRLVVVPAAQMQQMADAAVARYVAAHPPETQAVPAQPQQPTTGAPA